MATLDASPQAAFGGRPLMVFEAVNRRLLPYVPATARRLLDIGCGTGTLGRVLKESREIEVVGVTYSAEEANRARTVLDQVVERDLNGFDPSDLGRFDCIVCSHVLGCVYFPDQVLRSLRSQLADDGIVIVALPNVLHWRQRWRFLKGEFRYVAGSVTDHTQLRFFDRQTAAALVRDAGFTLDAVADDGGFPGSRRLPLGGTLDRLALGLSPGLFAWQFIVVGRPAGNRS
jgi:2-polyprenyl-3-methyl-5-hydroxy-6-metoxy-1,4-benzoquinol methylase